MVPLVSPFENPSPRVCIKNFALHSVRNHVTSHTGKGERRRKKNKYANFSKADQMIADPFETLISESSKAMREMKKEIALKNNKRVEIDEEMEKELKAEKRVRNKKEYPNTVKIDPYDPTTYGFVELGTVVGAHGIRGLVKIAAVTGFAERLCKPGIRHLKSPNRRSPREIRLMEGRLRMNNEYIVKFENVGDRNDANNLRGSVLYALQEERPEDIKDDEYLVTDLVGLDVKLVTGYDEDDDENDEEEMMHTGGDFVGTVRGIGLAEDMSSIPGLGHDWLEVILPRPAGVPLWKEEMVLIPFVPEIVPTVDIEREIIYIDPPAGLLDLTYIRQPHRRIKGFLPPAKNP